MMDGEEIQITRIHECKTVSDVEKYLMYTMECDIEFIRKTYDTNDLLEILDHAQIMDSKPIDIAQNFYDHVIEETSDVESDTELHLEFVKAIDVFVRMNTSLYFLRQTDMKCIKHGDFVSMGDKIKRAIFLYSSDDKALIITQREIISVSKKELQPFTNYEGMLSPKQLANAFEFLHQELKNVKAFSLVRFFSMFCDYFSISSDDAMSIASEEVTTKIKSELGEKILRKKQDDQIN